MTDLQAMTLAITGTDTGIGKTIVSCALAARARELGLRVAAMKPVETGIASRVAPSGSPLRSDAERLHDAAGADVPLDVVCPYALEEPLAPMVAAARAGVTFDLPHLDSARDSLARDRDLLIVEGAGGLLVPLTESLSFAQLFVRWQCGLVIVAGNRLGVLNHVLLTMRAAREEGLPIHGVVLTALSDRGAGLAEATNYDALCTLLPGVTLYRFPWVDRIDDPEALAAAAAGAGLDPLLLARPRSSVPDLLHFD
jgi:dethiobiotin synthetase